MKIKILGSAFAALLLGVATTSCTNEVAVAPNRTNGQISMHVAKSPDVNVWSGSQTLYGTTRTRGEEDGFDEEFTQSKYLNDEVEVNLSINDIHANADGTQKYEVDDLITKLSMHVRSGVDVRVTLPVPKEYYCDQDDLYIFNNHGGDIFANGGTTKDGKSSVEVKVGKKRRGGSLPSTGGCGCMTDKGCNCDYHGPEGNCGCDNMECPCQKGIDNFSTRAATWTEDELTETVTLNIEFKDQCIEIWTEGLDQDIIDWCFEKFDDGLNFEVYNYYNRSNMPVVDENGNVTGGKQTATYACWTLSELKEHLDGSYIEFLNDGVMTWDLPDYYINAFTGKTISHDDQLEYRDCYVRLNEQQGDYYLYPYFNYAHNGFNMNLIYQNSELTFEEGEEDPSIDKMPDYDDFFGVGKATTPAE